MRDSVLDTKVRIDGRKGGRMESEAFWLNISRETQGPARISDDFLAGLRRTTDVDRLRWKSYLSAGAREDAVESERVARAHCRSISGEIHSGFANLRAALPMNLKAQHTGFRVFAGARPDIARVLRLVRRSLVLWLALLLCLGVARA